MRGGPGADNVSGDHGIDDLHGGNGNDSLLLEGADTVRGGAGIDECFLLFGQMTAQTISCERGGDAPQNIRREFAEFRDDI